MRSGWEWFEGMGEPPVVVLDFDGTLSEIVERPGMARPLEGIPEVLGKLSGRVRVGVISGRALEDLEERLGVGSLYLAGSHGLEMKRPDGSRRHVEGLEEARGVLQEAAVDLRRRADSVEGVELEEKSLGLAVHYRRAPQAKEEVEAWVGEWADGALKISEGKRVRELRPALDWDKGDALGWILEEIGVSEGKDVIYIGDDRTDEDAFEALRALPFRGAGMLVAASPRPSAAQFRLAGPREVRSFLQELALRVYPSRPMEAGTH